MNRRNLILVAFAAVCLFHVLAIMGHMVREGRLSMVPVYDDVSYLVDGIMRMEVLDRSGIAGFLSDMHTRPAHAPFMAVAAAFGLLMSGGATWGAYMLNALWIFAFVTLALQVLRDLDLKSRIGIALAALAAPLFGIAVAEFRPDPVWGLLVGFTSVLLVTVDLQRAQPARIFLLGLLSGVAVLAKPTAAPASAAVIGITWLGLVGATLVLQRPVHRRAILRNSLVMALGAAVVVLPYAVTSGAEILRYIMMVMDPNNSVWRTQTSLAGHLGYYLGRNFGVMTLGWVWYAALPLILLALGVIVRARDHAALCAFSGLAAGLAMSYAIVTVSAVKSPMIGSILYGPVIATVLWCAGRIVRHVPLRHGLVLVLGALVFIGHWSPHVGMVQRADPGMQTTDDASRAALPVVVQALRTHANKNVVVTVPGPVYSGTLDYMARQQGVAGSFHEGYTWHSWEQFTYGIGTCDTVVVSEPGMLGQALGYSFPSVPFQPRVLQYLRESGAFDEHRVYTDAEGRSVWVYVRKASAAK